MHSGVVRGRDEVYASILTISGYSDLLLLGFHEQHSYCAAIFLLIDFALCFRLQLLHDFLFGRVY